MRLILLGKGGGAARSEGEFGGCAGADATAYVIDCGDGVARQLVMADVPLSSVRHVFLTHQHSDHNADYGNLMWLAWTAGPPHSGRYLRPSTPAENDATVLRDEPVTISTSAPRTKAVFLFLRWCTSIKSGPGAR